MHDADLVTLLEECLPQLEQAHPHPPAKAANLRTLLAQLPAAIAGLPAGDSLARPVLIERLEFLRQRAEREQMPANDLHWRLRELLLATLFQILGQRAA